MKFNLVEPVNQIESNLYVKHNVLELKDGELIQKCVHCGMVLEDLTPNANRVVFGEARKGMPTGDVYINRSGNASLRITQYGIELGLFNIPKEVIDCTALNS